MTKREIFKFKEFLVNSGVEFLVTTSEWEVLRFRANGAIGVVYNNKRSDFTFVNEAQKAYDAFMNNREYSNKIFIHKRQRASVLMRSVIERDGSQCFYCGKALKDDDMTIEHLLSISSGGSNHLSNLAISCKPCNSEAGRLPIVEKVKLRETKFKINNSNFKEAV
jgi:hypothetical protein